ncbi:MAG TPA: dockerin type I domain-containing protein, partial [Pirellulaceae bacterium]
MLWHRTAVHHPSTRTRRRPSGVRHLETLETRWLLASDWQNPLLAVDVDGSDGPNAVTPLDALLVINELLQRSVSSPVDGRLPELGLDEGSPPPFVDVDGNHVVSPLDALLVINQLGPGIEFENEATPRAAESVIVGSTAAANLGIQGDSLINTTTQNVQRDIDVATSDAGALWSVWSSMDQDGSSWGIFAQRFDDAGEMIGGEFRVNSNTRHAQNTPAVAVGPNGEAVVV